MPTIYGPGGRGSATTGGVSSNYPTTAVGGDPNDPYFEAGQGWRPGGPELWNQQHGINEETGDLEGPSANVPWHYARQIQAQHDRAVWRSRQAMMQDGINYQKGALGLLQSYRAGGGAALEAGVYNNLSNAQFTRAQLTQPMDFMSDLRRHEGAQAASRSNRAQERNIAVTVGSALAQAAVSYFAPGAAPYVAPLIGAAAGAAQQGSASAAPSYSANAATSPAGGPMPPTQGQQTTQGPRTPISQQGGPSTGAVPTGASASPTAEPLNTSGAATIADPEPGAPGAGGAGAPIEGGGGGPGDPGGGGAGQGVPGGDGMVAPIGAAAGADGDFSSNGFGRAAAIASTGNPGSDMMATAMNHYVADLYEQDAFYQSLPTALNIRWRSRMEESA